MAIKVDIKPEEFNKAVVEAVINSTIGTTTCIARELIQSKYKAQIDDRVKALLTDEFLEKIITKMWDAFLKETEKW